MQGGGNIKKIPSCPGSPPQDCLKIGVQKGSSSWVLVSPQEFGWMLYQNPSPGLVEGQILRRLPKSNFICQSGPSYFVCRSPVGIKIQNIFAAQPAPDAGVAKQKTENGEPSSAKATEGKPKTDAGTRTQTPDAGVTISPSPDAGVDTPSPPDAGAGTTITVRLDAGLPDAERKRVLQETDDRLRREGVDEDTIQKILGFLSRHGGEIAFWGGIGIAVSALGSAGIMIYRARSLAPRGNLPLHTELPLSYEPPAPLRSEGDTSHLAAVIKDFDRRGVEHKLRADDVFKAMVSKHYPEGFDGFEADHRQSLVRGVARVWERNPELQTMFPMGSDGLLSRGFIEVAVAVVERDEWRLENLAGEDHLKSIRYSQALARETGTQPRQLSLFEPRKRGAPTPPPPSPSPPPASDGPRRTVQLTASDSHIEEVVDFSALNEPPQPLPEITEEEMMRAAKFMGDLQAGLEDTIPISRQALDAVLAADRERRPTAPAPASADPRLDVPLKVSYFVQELAGFLAKQQPPLPLAEIRKIVDYGKALAELWFRNEGLGHKFQPIDGKLSPDFIEFGFAFVRKDIAKLNELMAKDPDLRGLFRRARALEQGIKPRRATQRRKPSLRKPMRRATAEEITIRTRGVRGILDGARGLATGLSPFIGAEVFEHLRFITPRQKGLGISLWFGGLTFLEPATPIHLLALGAPFHYTSESIRHGLDSTGVKPLQYDSLPNKISGLAGAGAVLEGAIVGLGRSQGAQTFKMAHQTGSQFLNQALMNGIPGARFLREATAHFTIGVGAALAVGWTGLKAGAVMLGEALAVPVATTAGAAVTCGAALGIGIYASGLGEKIGTDAWGEAIGDTVYEWFHPRTEKG